MSDLDALLAGIVAHPHEHLRWLIMADWLEDHGFPERAELVRVHRELLRTCTEPDAHPERPQLHARMMELMRSGVRPCLPQKTLTLPGGVELRMSFIPPGSFLMGSPDSIVVWRADERRREIKLTKGFWMGTAPVTQAQWKAVVGDNPSHFKCNALPVETISWDDAVKFCETMKAEVGVEVRLLTEAEWEYAARAGSAMTFPWGEELNGTQANCDGSNPWYPREGSWRKGPFLKSTSAVGSYETSSPHPWGLVDVIGNICEWCADWNGSPLETAVTDPAGPDSGVSRLFRGGSWNDHAGDCRAASRYSTAPNCRIEHIGFRIAADLE